MDDRTEAQPRSALARHKDGAAWWSTAISEVSENAINIRGHRVEDLIGNVTFVEHLVLLFTGRRVSRDQGLLLDAVMVAGADHGPLAPSISAARMAATCGITLNSAIATGINMLGEIHGGACAASLLVLDRVLDEAAEHSDPGPAASAIVREHRSRREPVPGFGHQLHSIDPRRAPVLDLLDRAASDGVVAGRHTRAARAIEGALHETLGRPLLLNIDGLWAIVCGELDLPAAFAMSAFCLSRGAGIAAHAFEESQSGVRIKGPCPPGPPNVTYTGRTPDPTPDP